MALKKDFMIGNTRIKIYDDSCVKTQEEIETILKRCGEIAYDIECRKAMNDTTNSGNNRECV